MYRLDPQEYLESKAASKVNTLVQPLNDVGYHPSSDLESGGSRKRTTDESSDEKISKIPEDLIPPSELGTPNLFYNSEILDLMSPVSRQMLSKVSVPGGNLSSPIVTELGIFEGPKTNRYRAPIRWKDRLFQGKLQRRPTIRAITRIILERPRGWNEKLKIAIKQNPQLVGPPQIDYRSVVYRTHKQLEQLMRPFTSCNNALKFMAIKAHVKFQVPIDLAVKWARNFFPLERFPGFSICVMTIRKDGRFHRYFGQEAVVLLNYLPEPGKAWKTTDFPLSIRQSEWNVELQGFATALASYFRGYRRQAALPNSKEFEEVCSAVTRQAPVTLPRKLGGNWSNFCNLQVSLQIQAEVTEEKSLFNKIRDVTLDNFISTGDSWSSCPNLTSEAEEIGMGPPPYVFMGVECSSEALLSIRRLTRVAVKNVLRSKKSEIVKAAKSLTMEWPRKALSDSLRKIISEEEWVIPVKKYLARISPSGLDSHPYAVLGKSTRSRGAANACCVGRVGGFSSALRLIVVQFLLKRNIDPGSVLRDHIDRHEEFSDLIKTLTESKELYFHYADLACREILQDRIDHLSLCEDPKCSRQDLHFDAPYVGITPFREGSSKLRTFMLVDTALMFLASGPASILSAYLKKGETMGEMFRGVEWSTGKRLNEGLQRLLGGEEDIFFLSLDSSRSTDFLRASLSRRLIEAAYSRLSEVVQDYEYDLKILKSVFAPVRLFLSGPDKIRPKSVYNDIPTYTSEAFASVALKTERKRKDKPAPLGHPGFIGKPTDGWSRRGLGLEAYAHQIQDHCLLGTFVLVAPTGYGKSIALPEICSSMSINGRRVKTIVFQPTTGIIESIHKENPEVSTLAMRYKVQNDSRVTYATGFYFLNELNRESSRFNCFVLDEIHLRRPDQLFALLLMRNRPTRNRIFVVTGATIDHELLSRYLSCPTLLITAPPQSLSERYTVLNVDKSDILTKSLEFLKGRWGSVLVFGEQISHSEDLARSLHENFPGSELCNYHGLCLPWERVAALRDLEFGKLRFIATSEMAEIGATFRRTILVINFRTTWLNMEDLKLGATSLVKIRSDDKTDTQRAGRCGRKEKGQELVKGLVLQVMGKVTGRAPTDPKHYVGEISQLLDLSTNHNVKVADLDLSLNLEQWKLVLEKTSVTRSPVRYAASEGCKAIGASGKPGDILLAACLTEGFPGRGELAAWKGTTADGIRNRWNDREIVNNVDKLVAQRFLHWMGYDMMDLETDDPTITALDLIEEPSDEAVHEAIKFFNKTDVRYSGVVYWEIKLRVSHKGEISGLFRVTTRKDASYDLDVDPIELKQEIGQLTPEVVTFGVSKSKGQVIKGLNYRLALTPDQQKTVSLEAWARWAAEESEDQKALRDWYLTTPLDVAFDISPMSSVASVCALSLTNTSVRLCPYYYRDRILKVNGGEGISAGYGDDISSIGDGSNVALLLFGLEYVQQDPNNKTVLSTCRRDGQMFDAALVQTECVYRFSRESESLERESILKMRFILSTLSEGMATSGCAQDRVNTWAYRKDFISTIRKVCPAFERKLTALFDRTYSSELEKIVDQCSDPTPLGLPGPGRGQLDCARILASCVPSIKTGSRSFVDLVLETPVGPGSFEPKNVMALSEVKDAIEVLVLPCYLPRKGAPKVMGLDDSIKLAAKSRTNQDFSETVLCFSSIMNA